MRILLVHNFSVDINGEDIYVLSLYNLLKKYKHQVVIYTKHNKNITPGLRAKLKIAKNFFWNQEVADELTDLIDRFKPDIAHVHNVYPLITPTVYQVCVRKKVCIVQTIHNYRFMCPKSFLFRNGHICEECVSQKSFSPSVYHGCYKRSRVASFIYSLAAYRYRLINIFDNIDRFIFPSEFTKNYYKEHLRLPDIRVNMLPYVVTIDSRNAHNKRDNYFLYAGRLSEEKGILQLLNIFASTPQIKLVVIGDGPLRHKVNEYKKYENIQIKGFLPTEVVYKYMKGALFTVIPSLWYEVLPLVLIESLANSTPVLVPKMGTFIHLIREKETGMFFRYADYDDLKKKLVFISSIGSKVEPMRRGAYQEYLNKYTEEVHIKLLISIYNDAVKSKRPTD